MNEYAKRVMMIGRMVDKLEEPTDVECSSLRIQLADAQSEIIDADLDGVTKDHLLTSIRSYQEYLQLHCPKGALHDVIS